MYCLANAQLKNHFNPKTSQERNEMIMYKSKK